MKFLVISTYPPMKCGIAAYASQMVSQLRKEGHVVDIFSPEEGNGDFTTDKKKINVLTIIRFCIFYDAIILQYHPSFFYPDSKGDNLLGTLKIHLFFILLFIILRRKLEIIIHEFPGTHESAPGRLGETIKWFFSPKLVFHTQKEVDDFQASYFRLSPNRYELRSPHAYYSRFRDISQKDARKELNISENALVFLCIGFIQPHKGFDRAVFGFKNIQTDDKQLYIVGSLRLELEEYIRYLDSLKRTAEKRSNIHVIERYLSDEEFDTWISASDIIVIPYREIWSSAVLGRAKVFDKRVIASDVGGLSEQLSDGDFLFQSDDELAEIFESF